MKLQQKQGELVTETIVKLISFIILFSVVLIFLLRLLSPQTDKVEAQADYLYETLLESLVKAEKEGTAEFPKIHSSLITAEEGYVTTAPIFYIVYFGDVVTRTLPYLVYESNQFGWQNHNLIFTAPESGDNIICVCTGIATSAIDRETSCYECTTLKGTFSKEYNENSEWILRIGNPITIQKAEEDYAFSQEEGTINLFFDA